MFEGLERLPADPILGLITAFNEDPDPRKVDLGAGVYKDDDGRTPIPEAVKRAEARYLEGEQTKAYVGPPGYPAFNERITDLLFGAGHGAVRDGRVRTVQTPGGCGALRVAAELIRRARPQATVWVSTPTWANHHPLLGNAGLRIESYPYYDHDRHTVRFDDMTRTLGGLGPDDVVLLHGCCHNPSGADLTGEQWTEVAHLAAERGFVPFIDIAYHGLADDLDTDARGPRRMAEMVPEALVAYSCSKNFGLYRDRVGALALVGHDAGAAERGFTQINAVTRGMYSMPPAHGAGVVMTILGDDTLRRAWAGELAAMRGRINELRALLANALAGRTGARDFGFIRTQRGMFSFLGIEPEQVRRLRDEYSIYLVDSSRINVAGISRANVEYVADAIAAVL